MAKIQPGPISSTTIQGWTRTLVQVKREWSHDWHTLYHTTALNVRESIEPRTSKASFIYHYGKIKRAIASTFVLWPADLQHSDWYVRFVACTEHGRVPFFHGIITQESCDLMGADAGGPAGDIVYSAYGLEYLLDRVSIRNAHVLENAAVVEIGRSPAFNERSRRGVQMLGNRTESEQETSHVFARDGEIWSHYDAVNYLLRYYQPGGPVFGLSGSFNALVNIKTVVPAEGLTLRQVLNKLINRRRGLSWQVKVHQDSTVSIDVYPVMNKDVKLAGKTIPGGKTHNISLADEKFVVKAEINKSTNTKFEKVIVYGANLKTCLSLDYDYSDNLEAGWTAQEETDFKNARDDKERASPVHDRVYKIFRAPDDWDWKAGVGHEEHTVNPLLDSNADIVFQTDSDGNPTDYAEEAEHWNAYKSFMNFLPLREDPEKDNADPEFRKPFVILKDPKEKNEFFQPDSEEDGCTVTMCDKELAIRVKFSQNHILGLNHCTKRNLGAGSSDELERYDWRSMIATVFLETDQRIRVEAEIGNNPKTEAERVLSILADDCELWIVCPYTVEKVKDGKYEFVYPKGTLHTDDPSTLLGMYKIVRDDREVLRYIAAMAKAWYSKPRAGITLSIKELAFSGWAGRILGQVSLGTQLINANTIISSVSWDLLQNISTIETDFIEFNTATFVDVPGMSDLRSVGRAFHRMENEIVEIQRHVSGMPARWPQGPPVLKSDLKHVGESTPNHSTRVVRECDKNEGDLDDIWAVRAIPRGTGEDYPAGSVIPGALPDSPFYKARTTPVGADLSGVYPYRTMWRVNDSFVEGTSVYAGGHPSTTLAADNPGGFEGGWVSVPGAPTESEYKHEDQDPNPGRIGQIGDIIHMDLSNRRTYTRDKDALCIVSIRHDANFFMSAGKDGRIYFTETLPGFRVLPGQFPRTETFNILGYPVIGEMVGDPDPAIINKNSGLGMESVNWRPQVNVPWFHHYPVTEVTGSVDGPLYGWESSPDGYDSFDGFTFIAQETDEIAASFGYRNGTIVNINAYVDGSGKGVFSAIEVNGNIDLTGTVDGRDVSADGLKLDIEKKFSASGTPDELLVMAVGKDFADVSTWRHLNDWDGGESKAGWTLPGASGAWVVVIVTATFVAAADT